MDLEHVSEQLQDDGNDICTMDLEIEQAAENDAKVNVVVSDSEDMEEDVDDDVESGCDSDEYYPYQGVDYKSVRCQRNDALHDWFGVDDDGYVKMATQSENPSEPVQLPLLARFRYKCCRRTADEVEKNDDVLVVLLAVDSQSSNFYVIYYGGKQGGVRFLEHTANIGEDLDMYPFSSLTTAAKTLYGRNANGWESFEIYDDAAYDEHGTLIKSAGPHHQKKVGDLRKSKGGPGFVNTFSPEKIAFWQKFGKAELNTHANYHFNLLCDEIQKCKSPSNLPDAQQEKATANVEEKQEEKEKKKVVAGKTIKASKRPISSKRVALEMQQRARVEVEEEEEEDSSGESESFSGQQEEEQKVEEAKKGRRKLKRACEEMVVDEEAKKSKTVVTMPSKVVIRMPSSKNVVKVARETKDSNCLVLDGLPFHDVGHTKETFEKLDQLAQERLRVILKQIQKLNRGRPN